MYTTTKRLICQAKILILFIFLKIKIDEPKYSIGSFLFSTQMSQSIGICRTLFLAFLINFIHNINLSVRDNACLYSFPFLFLLPLLLGGVGCRNEVNKEMKVRLKVILPRIIKIALVIEIITNAETQQQALGYFPNAYNLSINYF